MKHTEGPWAEAGIVGERFNIMAGAYTVAHVVMDGEHISDKSAYANARLIAAAPELLEALEAACRLDYFNEHNALASQARAAIAKATGE